MRVIEFLDANIFGVLYNNNKTAPAKTVSSAQKKQHPTRHVAWSPGNHYELVRKGSRLFTSTQEIDALEEHDESFFFIWKLREAEHVTRGDKNTPVYEAVYGLQDGSSFVRVKIKHLREAYRRAGRRDSKRKLDIFPDSGVPYWVDRIH